MRIKQLDLIGFKSFVQRTVLDFPAGITAIVGPNGCGKSNVVDAIRWVLGEQSPKHLRGDSMEDVIFKGNERLPGTDMAQVSLTFENDPDVRPLSELDLDVSTVPAHFRDLAEITVTRRYMRSGESEYFVNKTPCRLKDITELFLGTGVGSKAYAIIEQGRVEQLINAKPEDRRLFIEEAAGTTLYRSRKLAAERKMERTRENLLRVADVLREIDRQIQYLHRMARKAEQYRALQEEIRQLDLALAGAQWRRLTGLVSQTEAELAHGREQERQTLATLGGLEAGRGEKLAAQAAAEEALAHQRAAAAVLESECAGLRQRIDLLRREADERRRRGGRLAAEAGALAQQHGDVQQTIQQQERERAECAQLVLFDEGELEQKTGELTAARAQGVALNEQLETAQGAVVAVAAQEAEARNALAAYARRRDEARRRLEKLAAERAEASARLAGVDDGVRARRAAVAALGDRLRAAQGEKEQRAERVRLLAEDLRGCEREIHDAHAALLQLRSRVESLEAIQRNYEGYQPGVRSILLDTQPQAGVLGVVADVIDVPRQYERAVAAALGDRLQYVIVQQADDGVGAVATLRHRESGRGSFIPLSPRQLPAYNGGAASLNGDTRRLLDLVQVDEPYRRIAEALLGEVVLVPDIHAGLALWRRNGVHVTMVTPEGDVIDASGVITGGSERRIEEEIVGRRRQAGELAVEIAVLEERLSEAQATAGRRRRVLEEQQVALKELDRDTHGLTLELVTAEKDLERLEGERPHWLDRLEVVRFESANATAEEGEAAAQVEHLGRALQALASEHERVEAGRRASQEQAAAATVRAEALGADVTGIKVRVAERRQRQEAAAAALGRLAAQRDEIAARRAAVATEQAQTQQEETDLEAAARAAAAALAEQEEQRQRAESTIGHAAAGLEAAGAAVAAHDRSIHDTREQLDALRNQCRQHEVALAEQRLRAAHLAETMREKYGTDLAAELPAPTSETDEQSLARLEALREKLGRIGDVNVGAIDELRELEERAQFLRAQKDDLERSLTDLERTIQRLNRASRTRFAETFAAVNEKFQAVLPRLFRGGEARLVLTDEHNLLETGVDIVVRPPGKRLDTVTLLSGGEKALVAVSLIFSLFMINPTPFCFLDEVDAPLDDANIGRFTNLVHEMSAHSQFIVITHNKRTMQAADILYGVTMEEPGVSKVISVAMH